MSAMAVTFVMASRVFGFALVRAMVTLVVSVHERCGWTTDNENFT